MSSNRVIEERGMGKPGIAGKTGMIVLIVTLLFCSMLSVGAKAAEYELGKAKLTVKGAVTLGTAVRMTDRDTEVMNRGNAASISTQGDASARNSDDGSLNYKRGDIVSTVLKGVVSADLKYNKTGVLVRVKAWNDFTLNGQSAPLGHVANNYTRDSRLEDSGYNRRAKFTGVDLGEAYVYSSYDSIGQVKLGNQHINWGIPSMIRNSLTAIDPVDGPASVRPGALPEETKIPVPAISVKRQIGDNVTLQAFYQFMFMPNEEVGCGQFYSYTDYKGQDSCNKVFLGGTAASTDAALLGAGSYVNRTGNKSAHDQGEFGIALNAKSTTLKTDFGFYFANYHSRNSVVSSTKSTRVTTPFLANNADGKNSSYFVQYPENLQTVAVNFITRLPALTFTGQLEYQPNAIFRVNPGDLLNATASYTAATPLRQFLNDTPYGGVYDAYDRYRLFQLSLGVNKTISSILGAQRLTISGEVGAKYSPNLPNVSVMRYGRSDVYGSGPVAGRVCTGGAKACSTNGYVTEFSYGYRLRAGMQYPNITTNIDFLPSVVFGHDVLGYDNDNAFVEGRQFVRLSLRAEYRKRYYTEIMYVPTWGGEYNTTKDRSYASAVVGIMF